MTDINECDEGTYNCHNKADCQNSVGNYSCQCQTGFKGDGYFCEGKYFTKKQFISKILLFSY